MNNRLIVSAIIENDNQILFGRKKNNVGPYPNTWHLIGGGVNIEESLIVALKREIYEETGIKIDNIEPISFDKDIEADKNGVETRYIFLVFRAKYLSGEIRPNDDIDELKWFEKSELNKIKLNRPSIKLFKKIGYI